MPLVSGDPTMTPLFQFGANPILIGPEGPGQALWRVPLTPEGKGAFDEAWLQRLIHQNPSILPIEEIDPSLDAFFPICREMQTPRGFVDNLLMTGLGDIAIVETKLYRNPQARRETLAQILDYATTLFAMDYSAFEQCALKGVFAPSSKPKSLYEALPDGDKLADAPFADAVARNLRLGRATLLIVGDGIRSEAEQLLAGMHAHTRFGFTLALVELAVFRMPDTNRFLVQPRTLAKTVIVQRTVVEMPSSGPVIREERPVVPETVGIASYWEALEAKVPVARAAVEKLIKKVEPLGVYPEFLKSVNFKWARPGGKPVNLGYINMYVFIATDAAAWTAPRELANAYVKDVADTFGGEVHVMPISGNWMPYKNSAPLRLSAVLDRLDLWAAPMARFITAIEQYDRQAAE
jgi:hypothetical protein